MFKFKLKEVNAYSFLLHTTLLVFSILILILAKQNLELRDKLEGNTPKIQVGDIFEITEVKDIAGNISEVCICDTTIVFLFTTKCPICVQNLPLWNQIFKNKNNNTSIIALSLDDFDSTQQYVNRNKLPYNVYIVSDVALFRQKNKIYGVPTTVVVNPQMTITKLHLGLLKESDLHEI